jgi:hypothetical protein
MGDAFFLGEADPLPMESIWKSYVRTGEVTLLAAPGGSGKSSVLYSLAAILSHGALMPDGTESDVEKGSTLFAEFEDKRLTLLVPRLIAAGADMSKIADITDDGTFCIPDRLDWLEEQINKAGDCRLVVINPITTASTISINSGAQKIRHLLIHPMEKVAERTGAAFIIVGHCTKSGAIGGSQALIDAPRMVLQIVQTQNPEVRLLIRGKANANRGEGGIPFSLAGEGEQDTHVEWLLESETDVTPADIVPRPGIALTDKLLVLLALNSATEPLDGQTIRQTAAEFGPMPEYNSVRTALHRMVTRTGEVEQPGVGGRRPYIITDKGREVAQKYLDSQAVAA